jgi:hypothetical protein
MTEFTFIKQSADELHVGPAGQSPAPKDVVDRIFAIAKMSATELTELMGTEQGNDLARLPIVEVEGAPPESYLRPWDSIGRASPTALTDNQYDRFLRGEYPTSSIERTDQPIEIYGADLKRES